MTNDKDQRATGMARAGPSPDAADFLLAPTGEALTEADRHRDRFFRGGTYIMMTAPVILSLGLMLVGQGYRALLAAPVSIVGYAAWRLVQKGRITAAFRVGVYGAWFFLLLSAAAINGVEGPVISAVALILLLAGWLTGPRSVIVLTAATPVILFTIAYAQWNGWPFPVRVNATPFYNAVVHTCIMIGAGMLGYFAAQALRAQLDGLRKARDLLSDSHSRLEERERDLQRSDGELRILTQSLEKRVVERTAELQSAVRDLEGFASSIAHDLRAPLRAINANARLVHDGEAGSISEIGLRRLAAIERNALHMGQQVDGLLELARVKRMDLKRIRIDMKRIAQSALEDLLPLYPGAQITVQDLPGTEGDPSLVQQVFANLVGNALKYSSRREQSQVTVGWDGTLQAWFVRDNGVGFEMQHAAKIFASFERLHGSEFEGTGIGLAIVWSAIERHRGRVWAESTPGAGATFFFTLGAAAGPQPAPA